MCGKMAQFPQGQSPVHLVCVHGLVPRHLQLGFTNHLRPQGIGIGIEYGLGISWKNEPRTQFHFPSQLIGMPSGIAQIHMKSFGGSPIGEGLFELGLRGNLVDLRANLRRPLDLGRRLAQSAYLLRIDWTPEIYGVGTVFRGLVITQHAGHREFGSAVENQSDHTAGIVLNQQDYGLREIRIAEASAGHQYLCRAS